MKAKNAVTKAANSATLKVVTNPKNENKKPRPEEQPTPPALPAPAPETPAAPETEKSKIELKKQVVVRNIEATVQIVAELHRRTVHRDNLIRTVDNLDSFEFDLKDDGFHEGENYYNGCKVYIEDSRGRRFENRNAALVKGTADNIRNQCADKLGEIEATIVLPPAA